MSTVWYFACRNCPAPEDEENRDGDDVWCRSVMNHGEVALANAWRLRQHIKAVIEEDSSGYLEVHIMGYGAASPYFLARHADHPGFELCSEYGDIVDLERRVVHRRNGAIRPLD